jgi:hypothetical protein
MQRCNISYCKARIGSAAARGPRVGSLAVMEGGGGCGNRRWGWGHHNPQRDKDCSEHDEHGSADHCIELSCSSAVQQELW